MHVGWIGVGPVYKIVKVNLGRGLQQRYERTTARPKGRCLANFYFLDLENDHELVGHDHGSENNAIRYITLLRFDEILFLSCLEKIFLSF